MFKTSGMTIKIALHLLPLFLFALLVPIHKNKINHELELGSRVERCIGPVMVQDAISSDVSTSGHQQKGTLSRVGRDWPSAARRVEVGAGLWWNCQFDKRTSAMRLRGNWFPWVNGETVTLPLLSPSCVSSL